MAIAALATGATLLARHVESDFCEQHESLRLFLTDGVEGSGIGVVGWAEELAQRYEQLRDHAPEEIRQQVAVVAEHNTLMAEAAIASGGNFFQAIAMLPSGSQYAQELRDAEADIQSLVGSRCLG